MDRSGAGRHERAGAPRDDECGDDRYRVGNREYHADCFDISLFGASSASALRME